MPQPATDGSAGNNGSQDPLAVGGTPAGVQAGLGGESGPSAGSSNNAMTAAPSAGAAGGPSSFGGEPGASAVPDPTGIVPNAHGASATFSTAGTIDEANEFFRAFGNGRACASCHRPDDGFTITPNSVRDLFEKCGLASDTASDDSKSVAATACALFKTNDGAVSPNADVSTAAARRAAYQLLLSRGLIRITFGVPDASKRQFDIVDVRDPYGFATSSTISVFRRPLPATNLPFESSVMWDLRETTTGFFPAPYTPDVTNAPALEEQLERQATNATLGHAEASMPGLTDVQAQAIVDFELGLFSAQSHIAGAGDLSSGGGAGGPRLLAKQPVTPVCGNVPGIDNNPKYPQCQKYVYTPTVFSIFDAWQGLSGTDEQSLMRASIARGQALFNTRRAASPPDTFFDHSGDNRNLTCSTCHSSFNTGGSSVPLGFANVVVGVGPGPLNRPSPPHDFLDPDLPAYQLRCNARGMASFRATGGNTGCHDGSEPGVPADELTVNDLGRAGITGAWLSLAAFKTPTLRNLAARPPYFHDGSAATLLDVVEHYKTALGFEFSPDEAQDLVNFLSAL